MGFKTPSLFQYPSRFVFDGADNTAVKTAGGQNGEFKLSFILFLFLFFYAYDK